MKLSCVIALLIAFGSAALAAEARELIFYTEPPATYLNAIEVVSVASSNVAFTTVVLPNGQREEIPRGGIVAIVPLPPRAPSIASSSEANDAIRKIRSLEVSYPQYEGKLASVLSAWNAAVAYSREHNPGNEVASKSMKSGTDLEVDGTKYHDVALLSFNGEEVGFSHADGAATIPAGKLTSAQIAALNATNTSIHITPSEIKQPHAKADSATPKPQSLVSVSTVDSAADGREIARLQGAVVAAEANLNNLRAEQAALKIKINATPNRLRNSPEFQAATRRDNALHAEIQQAQIACGDATENLRKGERDLLSKTLNAAVEAYRATAILPADVSGWGELEKKWLGKITIPLDSPTAEPDLLAAFEDKWSTEVTERTKSATAADEAARKANSGDSSGPEADRLNLISEAEEKKLQIATETLKAIQTRLAATDHQIQLEKQQMAEAQRQSAEAAKIEEKTNEFRALPAVTDRFVQPESLLSEEPPTYAETIEFINSRLSSPFLGRSTIGFGEQLRKIIWRGDGFAYAFDPADLNADVKYSSNSVILECRNRKGQIHRWTSGSADSQFLWAFHINTVDEIDSEKMAKAFSHLILMFGGKKDAF